MSSRVGATSRARGKGIFCPGRMQDRCAGKQAAAKQSDFAIAQRLDRMEPCRGYRGVNPEENTNQERASHPKGQGVGASENVQPEYREKA